MSLLVGLEGKKQITFENGELLIQIMKNSFACNFLSWIKLCIDEGPLPIINFFDWLV